MAQDTGEPNRNPGSGTFRSPGNAAKIGAICGALLGIGMALREQDMSLAYSIGAVVFVAVCFAGLFAAIAMASRRRAK